MGVEISSPNIQSADERFRRAPKVAADLVEKNLRSLGEVIAAKERRVLDVVKYRGSLARSISTWYEGTGTSFTVIIGPALPDKHGFYVYYGTRPHVPPIGPLKEWVRWKFGGAKLRPVYHRLPKGAEGPTKQYKVKPAWSEDTVTRMAYAVRASIARRGTSVHIEKLGLGDGHGGYQFPQRTLARPDVQLGIARTAQRIPVEVLRFVETGQVATAATGEA